MEEKRVPLAWSVRWRRIRSQGVPVATFLVALAASMWLWQERGIGVQSIGEVASPRVNVTSPTMGTLVALPNHTSGNWSLYDRVQAGDVIARIEAGSGDASKTIEITAPVGGTLIDMPCWPGQMVIPGQLIATIAADHGRNVMGYIPEDSVLKARRGMPVTLRGRTAGSPRVVAEVDEVGVHIERVPRHQLANSTLRQWGTPVRIKLPDDAPLQPGALVDVHFDSSGAE